MSARGEVLLWAQRIVAKANALPHQLLEIQENAGVDRAQEAFHKIARMAHPDLHRTTLSAEELETVTLAYSRVAGAYQELRTQRATTTRLKPLTDSPPIGAPARKPVAGADGVAPTAPVATPGATGPAGAMNSKALIYYRKAELSLRRGDLKGALLQLKMAIAGDPQSTLLRSALAEVEAELARA